MSIEKNGSKFAALLGFATLIPVGATAYAMDLIPMLESKETIVPAAAASDAAEEICADSWTIDEAEFEEAKPVSSTNVMTVADQSFTQEFTLPEPVEEAAPAEDFIEPEAEALDAEIPAEEVPAEVPAEDIPVETAPVEVPVEQVYAEVPAEQVYVEAPVEQVYTEVPAEQVYTEVPVEQVPVEQIPVEQPAPEVPVEQIPVEQPAPEIPVEQAPVEQPAPEIPVEQPPVEQIPVEQAPVEQPVPEVPVEQPAPEAPVEQPAPEVPVEQPAPEVPADPYASINAAIAEAAKNLVGVTNGLQCTEVVQQALADAGVQDAMNLWPDEYADTYGYYTDTPQAGNLIYYNNGGRGDDHIAIYIGDGQAVHGNITFAGNENSVTAIYNAEFPGSGEASYIQVVR